MVEDRMENLMTTAFARGLWMTGKNLSTKKQKHHRTALSGDSHPWLV